MVINAIQQMLFLSNKKPHLIPIDQICYFVNKNDIDHANDYKEVGWILVRNTYVAGLPKYILSECKQIFLILLGSFQFTE